MQLSVQNFSRPKKKLLEAKCYQYNAARDARQALGELILRARCVEIIKNVKNRDRHGRYVEKSKNSKKIWLRGAQTNGLRRCNSP